MATGGIFQLITNDGKQDRMLMASALLASRIQKARENRKCAGQSDCTPTLYDIERTHILFTSAHFKPFAAIGYEYNKVTPTAGTVALNENSTQNVTFSIPQFGDFFCDMIVHVTMEQPKMEYSDSVLDSQKNLFRWCDYPGERLLKRVKFEVNGNPLDEYTSDAVNFHREFLLQPNKELGWNRCMGQEEVEEGWVDQPNWVNSGVSSSDINYRTKVHTTSGLQTPTGNKQLDVNNDGKTDKVELFIPLLFWCNKDPRLAVPSVAIPYGQRFITVELAPWRELVGVVPRGHEDLASVQADPDKYGKLVANDMLKNIELYINNIFVNPEVHNIFIKRIGFTLIRVHRQQNNDDSEGSQDKSQLLQNLKWPIEAMFVGMRIKKYSNGSPSDIRQNLDKWHKFHKVQSESRSAQGWNVLKEVREEGLDLDPVTTFVGPNPSISGSGKVVQFTYNAQNDHYGTKKVYFGDIDNINSSGRLYVETADTMTSTEPARALYPASKILDKFTVGNHISFNKKEPNGDLHPFVLRISGVITVIDDNQNKGYLKFEVVVGKDHINQLKLDPTGESEDGITVLTGSFVNEAVKTSLTITKENLFDCFCIVKYETTPMQTTVDVCRPTLEYITIKAHGIPIYNHFPAKFYNAYIPYNYGGHNIRAPKDCGAMMITFCLYPGTYQPSGHINVSRAREFYIDYKTTGHIGNNPDGGKDTGTLVIVASAINFLLISDGSAVLRYST